MPLFPPVYWSCLAASLANPNTSWRLWVRLANRAANWHVEVVTIPCLDWKVYLKGLKVIETIHFVSFLISCDFAVISRLFQRISPVMFNEFCFVNSFHLVRVSCVFRCWIWRCCFEAGDAECEFYFSGSYTEVQVCRLCLTQIVLLYFFTCFFTI